MTDPVLATVVLGGVSGLPEDNVVTDWSFNAAALNDPTLDDIAASLVSFFNTANTLSDIAGYIGGQVSRVANAATIKFYDLTGDLDGSPHGSPIHQVPFTLNANENSADLPSEVAIVQTLWAAGWSSIPEKQANPSPPPAFIRPQARYRGRIYLGPFNLTAMTVTTVGEPRVHGNLMGDLDAAWFRFMDERPDFGVWSRRDAVIRNVAGGALDGRITVDNAFDTQRRRGVDATVRTQVWP